MEKNTIALIAGGLLIEFDEYRLENECMVYFFRDNVKIACMDRNNVIEQLSLRFYKVKN